MGNHDDPGERFHPQSLRLRLEMAQPRYEDIGIAAPIWMMRIDELSAAPPLRLLHPPILRDLSLDQPQGTSFPRVDALASVPIETVTKPRRVRARAANGYSQMGTQRSPARPGLPLVSA
jgi:hypothetical protein